jgi:hypothetical protein
MKHNVVVLLLNDNFTTNEIHQMKPPRLSSVRKAGMTDTGSFGSWCCPKSSLAPTAAVPCYLTAGCHS